MADHMVGGAPFPSPISMGALLDSIILLPNLQVAVPSASVNGVQFSRGYIQGLLAAGIAAFTAPKLILYTNNYVWTANAVAGDLVEPTGTWYARKVAVPGAIHDGAGNVLNFGCTSVEWDYSGVSPAALIQGWALIDVF